MAPRWPGLSWVGPLVWRVCSDQQPLGYVWPEEAAVRKAKRNTHVGHLRVTALHFSIPLHETDN
eukprot:933085-Pelagomonas_calceolata.AAC.2